MKKKRITLTRPTKRRNLQMWMTIIVSIGLMLGVLAAIGIAMILEAVVPKSIHIPMWLEFLVFSLLIGWIVTWLLSKYILNPTQELGRAMEVLQTDFVSNVSHELKTPLSAIEGYSTLLQGCEALDAEQQEYVEKILFNTKRLSNLVGNILLLSKLENQEVAPECQVYRLDEQIRQSILALETEWTDKQIEFDIALDAIEYFGNEGIMHHVWDNLIANAIKFNPEYGMLGMTLKKEGEQIVYTITDSGPGISDEVKTHIFDKFYQADSSHKQEGNGLGLALVKRIVMIEGGEIDVENVSGGGCRFTVTLPA